MDGHFQDDLLIMVNLWNRLRFGRQKKKHRWTLFLHRSFTPIQIQKETPEDIPLALFPLPGRRARPLLLMTLKKSGFLPERTSPPRWYLTMKTYCNTILTGKNDRELYSIHFK